MSHGFEEYYTKKDLLAIVTSWDCTAIESEDFLKFARSIEKDFRGSAEIAAMHIEKYSDTIAQLWQQQAPSFRHNDHTDFKNVKLVEDFCEKNKIEIGEF